MNSAKVSRADRSSMSASTKLDEQELYSSLMEYPNLCRSETPLDIAFDVRVEFVKQTK